MTLADSFCAKKKKKIDMGLWAVSDHDREKNTLQVT